MSNKFNLIFDEEYVYGFLSDLIKYLKEEREQFDDQEQEQELITDAINDAETLLENDDCFYIYCMHYNTMGAFVFERYVRGEK